MKGLKIRGHLHRRVRVKLIQRELNFHRSNDNEPLIETHAPKPWYWHLRGHWVDVVRDSVHYYEVCNDHSQGNLIPIKHCSSEPFKKVRGIHMLHHFIGEGYNCFDCKWLAQKHFCKNRVSKGYKRTVNIQNFCNGFWYDEPKYTKPGIRQIRCL